LTRLIVILIILSILFLITFNFIAVLIRRFYMDRKYRALDAERERYAPFEASLVGGGVVGDLDRFRNPPGSFGWKAVEEILFRALDDDECDTGLVRERFEELGYTDYYIERLRLGGRWERAVAADKLGRTGCVRAVPVLVEALGSKYRDLRNMAVYSLGLIGDARAVAPLVEMLRQSVIDREEASVRIVKSSLISLGAASVGLVEREARGPLWQVRAAAVDILGEIALPEAAGALRDALEDTDRDIRAKAAKGLGRIRDRTAAPQLIRHITDPFWVVRLHSARALGLIGESAAMGHIKQRLTDENWQVRRVASEALGEIGDEGIAVLLEVFLESEDVYAREQAADELERDGVAEGFIDFMMESGRALGRGAALPQPPPGRGVYLVMARLIKRARGLRLAEVLGELTGREFAGPELEDMGRAIACLSGPSEAGPES